MIDYPPKNNVLVLFGVSLLFAQTLMGVALFPSLPQTSCHMAERHI
jgi:hypothetical protein